MASVCITRVVGKDGKSISWRAQVRVVRGGKLVYSQARTFERKALAAAWGAKRRAEVEGMALEDLAREARGGDSVGDLIRRYQAEYAGLARMGRTKSSSLAFLLKQPVAGLAAVGLSSRDLVEHVRARRAAGAGPETAMNDLIWLRVVFKVARPAWGIPVDLAAIEDAMAHLKAHGLVGKGQRRERRPTAEELTRLTAYFESRDGRASIPMVDMIWFAIHSARREAEITRLLWEDLSEADLTGVVRDLKHPRLKAGNNRVFKFTAAGWEIVKRQPRTDARVFPYNPKSVSAAFTRACHLLGIEDLCFHDLRHEATSRLFEAGYPIEIVQLFTLHEDWQVLRRYTHLRPGQVVLR